MTVPVSIQVPSLGAWFSRIQDQMPALKSTEASRSEPASRGAGVRAIRDRRFAAHKLCRAQAAEGLNDSLSWVSRSPLFARRRSEARDLQERKVARVGNGVEDLAVGLGRTERHDGLA